MYINKLTFYFLLGFSVLSCNSVKEQSTPKYMNQIGDTIFDAAMDNPNFKFCDSSNVFHQRNSVYFTGGLRAMEHEIIHQYSYKPDFSSFSGSFFIRFAINCNDETGRFRWQIVDEDFKETKCPSALESQIIAIVRGVKGWNHVKSDGHDYDGYTFIIITFENGKIIES